MVSLKPDLGLDIIFRNSSNSNDSSAGQGDKRTHLDRIKDALNSGNRLDKMAVDYKGTKKNLQDYILEDVLYSSDISALRFVHFPQQDWTPSTESERLTKYFWGYTGWNAFFVSYIHATKLSKIDWMENYNEALAKGMDLSNSVGGLLNYRIFSNLQISSSLRKVKGAVDGSISFMQQVERQLPDKRLSDILTKEGRRRMHERSWLELKLQQGAYGLVLSGNVAKGFISELGHNTRKEYIRANPEQLKLF